ncbi:MAG: hypothetical protein Q8P80_01040 [Candidatus Levybacteria bacterium]|nr:hypothetical protein [Candidatus Levybacteria bacterium]
MERFRQKPSLKEIFYALVDIDNRPDWNIEILETADPKDVREVRSVLEQGLPLGEAEIEVGRLKENDRDF